MMGTVKNTSQKLLEIVAAANNLVGKTDRFTKFYIENYHVGFLNTLIITELQKRNLINVHDGAVHLKTMSKEQRSETFAVMLNELRTENKYRTLRGWRNELYDVWVKGRLESLMVYERSAAPLFGFTTYGVHVNGYVNHPERGWCMWVGRRSPTKQTYPNMLDQVVAGGLTNGLSVLECCVKECQEEASLPKELVSRLKSTGTVTCFYEDERGICPECEYIYDIELPEDYEPRCQDGEMEGFQLLPYEEVINKIAEGEFKTNCAITCLDFFIRHGVLSPDNEPYYNQLMARLHIKLPQD